MENGIRTQHLKNQVVVFFSKNVHIISLHFMMSLLLGPYKFSNNHQQHILQEKNSNEIHGKPIFTASETNIFTK